MPLSASVLAASLKTAFLADPDTLAVEGDPLDSLCKVIADVVVAHVIANAVVTVPPGVAVATAGGPAAQTGATTAPGIGTIS